MEYMLHTRCVLYSTEGTSSRSKTLRIVFDWRNLNSSFVTAFVTAFVTVLLARGLNWLNGMLQEFLRRYKMSCQKSRQFPLST